jgi:uncharacterized protein (TIGR02145 family)
MEESVIIKIIHTGDQSLNVIKIINDYSKLSINECSVLLKHLPAVISFNIEKENLEKLFQKLKSVGIKFKLIANGHSESTVQKIYQNIILSDARDGFYKAVKIGTQYWMAENLNTNTFQNGDSIPTAHEYKDWKVDCERIPLQASFNFNRNMDHLYGKIYNYKSIIDERGLAPIGWRIPSVRDWNTLLDFLGKERYSIDYQMKSMNSWISGNGNNHSGFNAIPAGHYCTVEDKFIDEGLSSSWWSIDANHQKDLIFPYHFTLFSYKNMNSGFELNFYESNLNSGFYLRCVSDELSENCILI